MVQRGKRKAMGQAKKAVQPEMRDLDVSPRREKDGEKTSLSIKLSAVNQSQKTTRGVGGANHENVF